MKVLITSGGTKIPIDSVRAITNMSRGTFGSQICRTFLQNGHNVTFFHAENSLNPFMFNWDFSENTSYLPTYDLGDFRNFCDTARKYYTGVEYKTYDDYAVILESLLKERFFDVIILAAGVSDYGIANPVNGKIRSKEDLTLNLTPLPKLISQVRGSVHSSTLICGFKLLVNSNLSELKNECLKSIESNRLNMIIGNDLSDIKSGKHRLLYMTNKKTFAIIRKSSGLKLAQSVYNYINYEYEKICKKQAELSKIETDSECY